MYPQEEWGDNSTILENKWRPLYNLENKGGHSTILENTGRSSELSDSWHKQTIKEINNPVLDLPNPNSTNLETIPSGTHVHTNINFVSLKCE
jgi:hypothetical protein